MIQNGKKNVNTSELSTVLISSKNCNGREVGARASAKTQMKRFFGEEIILLN